MSRVMYSYLRENPKRNQIHLARMWSVRLLHIKMYETKINLVKICLLFISQEVLDDVKVRLSDFPGECSQVELIKFMISEDVDAKMILAGLVQTFMSYNGFSCFKLHDNFSGGADARKYRHLKGLWSDMLFQRNAGIGFVLDCSECATSCCECRAQAIIEHAVVDDDQYHNLVAQLL